MRRLVVALHDVAPPFEAEIRQQLAALDTIGVHPVVLKVVPNWNAASPLEKFPDFVQLLMERRKSGDEIVLHGWEHRVNGSVRGSVGQRFRAKLFARHSEEFLVLTRHESAERVASGIEVFELCGLGRPTTFSPPGWLISSEAERGVADAGIHRLVKMFTLDDFDHRTTVHVPAFGYMGAGPKQELGVGILNELVTRLWTPRSDFAKAFLHPLGGTESKPARRTLARIGRMVNEGWLPSTFEQAMSASDG